jgi:hypothetical protein
VIVSDATPFVELKKSDNWPKSKLPLFRIQNDIQPDPGFRLESIKLRNLTCGHVDYAIIAPRSAL